MRALTMGLPAGLLGSALVYAQPTPQPDFARATYLYNGAAAAMSEGRFSDAARDYGAAYDITRDPILFYKIGTADEKAGKCDAALIYYGRYLREANPSPKFVDVTKERITACGGDARNAATLGTAAVSTGSGSAEPPDHGSPHGRDGAWLMVGGSLASITVGAVLAYSASSSEQDLKDLYVGLGGSPPVYDAKTAKRYQDLLDEGHRYRFLSVMSFGLAAGFAAGAVILFATGDHHESGRVHVAPVVTPHEAGVAATVRF